MDYQIYDEGRTAYNEGSPITANPYIEGGIPSHVGDWIKGYGEAQDQHSFEPASNVIGSYYRQGRDGYEDGIDPAKHPYVNDEIPSRRASDWMAGYLDAKDEHDNQPAFDLIDYITRQQEWSLKTFGPGLRTEALTAHIAKELDEVRENPTDIVEAIDIIILGLDLAYRTGATPEAIVAALEEKQRRNFEREWHDPVKGEPTEHKRVDARRAT